MPCAVAPVAPLSTARSARPTREMTTALSCCQETLTTCRSVVPAISKSPDARIPKALSQDLGDAGPTGPAQAPRLPVANSTWYGEAGCSPTSLPLHGFRVADCRCWSGSGLAAWRLGVSRKLPEVLSGCRGVEQRLHVFVWGLLLDYSAGLALIQLWSRMYPTGAQGLS